MTMTLDRRAELLAAAPLLAGVQADGLTYVAERAVEVEFAPGTVIARAGRRRHGAVHHRRRQRARGPRRRARSRRLGPGEFFGELSVLDGQPRIAHR